MNSTTKMTRKTWSEQDQTKLQQAYALMGYKPAEVRSKFFEDRSYSTIATRLKHLHDASGASGNGPVPIPIPSPNVTVVGPTHNPTSKRKLEEDEHSDDDSFLEQSAFAPKKKVLIKEEETEHRVVKMVDFEKKIIKAPGVEIPPISFTTTEHFYLLFNKVDWQKVSFEVHDDHVIITSIIYPPREDILIKELNIPPETVSIRLDSYETVLNIYFPIQVVADLATRVETGKYVGLRIAKKLNAGKKL